MMLKKLRVAACAALIVALASCAPAPTTKVARVDSDITMDISGRWNDTDSRLVADEMVTDALNQRWIYKWEEMNKVPTVIIGRVQNKSHEHINVQTFVKDIERSLLNSGKVDFVASGNVREEIRDERDDQHGMAAMETRSFSGNETGADLMMVGTINTIVDQEGKRAVIFYQVDMELIELETTRKVWSGGKKIKKYVERASVKF